MNKLKSMFKKDKDGKSESTPSHQYSGSESNDHMSQGGAAAAYGGGASSERAQPPPATGMSSVAAVPQQSSGAGYGREQSGGAGYGREQSGGAAYGREQSLQEPTDSAFPPNNAPSTGVENAERPQGVVMHTTLGDITIALFAEQTPRVCS